MSTNRSEVLRRQGLFGANLLFNIGNIAFTSLIPAYLAASGVPPAAAGVVRSVAEGARIPVTLLVPLLATRMDARALTTLGLASHACLQVVFIFGLTTQTVTLVYVANALVTMLVFIGLPAYVVSVESSAGRALARLSIIGEIATAITPALAGAVAARSGLGLVTATTFACGSLATGLVRLSPRPQHLQEPPTATGVGRWILSIAPLAAAGAGVIEGCTSIAVPFHLVALGYGLGEVGALTGLSNLIVVFGLGSFGWLVDHRTPRTAVVSGLLLASAALFPLGNTELPLVIGIGNGLVNLGRGGAIVGSNADTASRFGRAHVIGGFATIEVFLIAGRTVGALVSGLLLQVVGARLTFVFFGLFGVCISATAARV